MPRLIDTGLPPPTGCPAGRVVSYAWSVRPARGIDFARGQAHTDEEGAFRPVVLLPMIWRPAWEAPPAAALVGTSYS